MATALPYLPFAGIIDFAAPGAAVMGAILALVLLYLGASELLKRIAMPIR